SNRQDKMPFAAQRTCWEFVSWGRSGFFLGMEIGHRHYRKGDNHQGDKASDNQVGNIEAGIAGIRLWGLRQDERASQDGTKSVANGIAALRKIDARHPGIG